MSKKTLRKSVHKKSRKTRKTYGGDFDENKAIENVKKFILRNNDKKNGRRDGIKNYNEIMKLNEEKQNELYKKIFFQTQERQPKIDLTYTTDENIKEVNQIIVDYLNKDYFKSKSSIQQKSPSSIQSNSPSPKRQKSSIRSKSPISFSKNN